MREFFAVVLAVLASALTSALALAGPFFLEALVSDRSPDRRVLVLFTVTFYVSLGFSGSLGLLAAFVLLRLRRFRIFPMALSGAFIGIVPIALVTGLHWPHSFLLLAIAGLLGGIGASAYFLVYRGISHHPSIRSSQRSGPN
ncbi:MAG: hypothetical protein IPK97_07985 [Ahniella sp.]|nr:hypothetical protein [Ahniella sp.]